MIPSPFCVSSLRTRLPFASLREILIPVGFRPSPGLWYAPKSPTRSTTKGLPKMIYVNVVLTVKEAADIPQIRTLLAEQCRLSRLEPGCAVRGLSLHKRSAGFHSERALGIAGSAGYPSHRDRLHHDLSAPGSPQSRPRPASVGTRRPVTVTPSLTINDQPSTIDEEKCSTRSPPASRNRSPRALRRPCSTALV